MIPHRFASKDITATTNTTSARHFVFSLTTHVQTLLPSFPSYTLRKHHPVGTLQDLLCTRHKIQPFENTYVLASRESPVAQIQRSNCRHPRLVADTAAEEPSRVLIVGDTFSASRG